MSDIAETANSVDVVEVAEKKNFIALIPTYFGPLSGFRTGWQHRVEGKRMVTMPYFTDAEWDALPKYTGIWYDGYSRGWYAADDYILAAERSIVEQMKHTYVQSYI